LKWRIKERARLERARGKRVYYDSRRLWIEGREWSGREDGREDVGGRVRGCKEGGR